MASNTIITDVGKEWIARWLHRSRDWVPEGYELFSYHSWGEGAFKVENGVRVPIPPGNFRGNTDLEIVENPGVYSSFSGDDFASDYRKIEWDVEADYLGGADEITRIIPRLEESEANNSPNTPQFFELGIYDNAGDLASQAPFDNDSEFSKGASGVRGGTGEHHLIMYTTFDSRKKTDDDIFQIELDLPMDP